MTAFYLQIWFQDDFRNFWDSCPWEEDLSYCRQVSAASTAPSAGELDDSRACRCS